MPEATVTIEVIGEGKADVGKPGETMLPEEGVVPILLYKLCGKPAVMRVKPKHFAQLQAGKLSRKVQFAKRQARCTVSTDALVFVIDSEGDHKESDRKTHELQKGRDADSPDFPTAVGVAQPCIEAWLLADAPAIRRGMGLERNPDVPHAPEDLPAPVDTKKGPKGMLAKLVRSKHRECSSDDKNKIARAMNDMELVRERCPLSFVPFADEVKQHIRPLF